MRRFLLALLVAFMAGPGYAAQVEITTVSIPETLGGYRGAVNERLGFIDDNFNELYGATDSDTIAALSCSENQIAKWNGSAWACAADAGTEYTAGTGIDITGTVVSSTVVDTFATWDKDYDDLTNAPALNPLSTTTLTCDSGEVPKWDGSAWGCADDATIEAGSDTLGSLDCADDQVAAWSGTAWVCADVEVTGTVAVAQGGTGSTTESAARTALGLAIGTNVQAYDADLTTYAGITPSADVRTVLGSATASNMRSNMGVAIGTNVQAYDADLAAIAALTCTSTQVAKWNGSAWACADDTQAASADITWTGAHTFQGNVNLPADVTLPDDSVRIETLDISGAEVGGFFSGVGTYLKKDGTTGTPIATVDLEDIGDWPATVSADEVAYLNGLSGNIQSQITAITAGGVSILATDPTAPSEGTAWINTTDSKFKVASDDGLYSTAALTYAAWDKTPADFTFNEVVNADPSTEYTSDSITVSEINYPTEISVSGGTYSKTSNSTGFTSTAGTVISGDSVWARLTSSADAETETSCTVTIGGVSDAYVVTTAAGSSTCVGGTTDYLGWTSFGTNSTYASDDAVRINYYAAPVCGTSGCTAGDFTTAAVYNRMTTTDTNRKVKVCVWEDDGDEAPDSGDTFLGCSEVITNNGSTGWQTASMGANVAADCSTGYFIGIISSGSYRYGNNTTGGEYYSQTITDAYSDTATNVADLGGTWTSTTTQIAVNVTIE